jgi:plastocyanin
MRVIFSPHRICDPDDKIMKINSAIVLLTGLAAVQSVGAADITGTVTLKGTPPPERAITFAKEDPNCGKLMAEAPKTKFYVVGAKGELADTIVMLKNPPSRSSGATAAPVILDQKGCQFAPQILAVQTGQKLLVKNSDPVLHNVHTMPTVSGNPPSNQGQIANGPDLTLTFPAAENFLKFQCDVHSGPSGSWMLAWVTVVDHPYFGVSGKDGTFKISNVPPGKYIVTALHRKAALTGVEKEIEVKEVAPATLDFTLEVPPAAK